MAVQLSVMVQLLLALFAARSALGYVQPRATGVRRCAPLRAKKKQGGGFDQAAAAAAPKAAAPKAKGGAKSKKAARLEELQELSGATQDATAEWAEMLTRRLDIADASADADSAAAALLDACGESDRDLEKIDGIVAELAALPGPGAADATSAVRGDWRLSWARSDDGVGSVGTGLHRVPLASLEDIFLSLAPKRVLTSEVIRVLGPFPNVKNTLEGTSKVRAGATLDLSYDTVVDGLGATLTDTQARKVSFDLVALTRDVLVLRAPVNPVGGDEWLVFERELDLAAALDKLRVAPVDDGTEPEPAAERGWMDGIKDALGGKVTPDS
jgi:hypothetical protein